jgi:purine-nucleoside/S-methyl-5'-thioadenosine phosphorylase / adenosine deaminase
MMTTMSTCRPSCGTEPEARNTGIVSLRVRRVTTTRTGGVSAPPFDTFNMGDHVGDDPAAVAANRRRLGESIGLGADRIVWMNQTHSDRVAVVDGPTQNAVDDVDGLVTTSSRLALAVVTADCVPVLMADARRGVVAAVHAGRVGAQNGVVVRALEAMVKEGARVEDVSVLLGPAVSGRNYEVPDQMAAEVEAALPGSRTTTARGTAGLDLRAGITRQLTGLGVTAIAVDPRCTVDDTDLFSHRRGAPTGRLAALVWWE